MRAPMRTWLAENTSQLNPMFTPSSRVMSPPLHDRMLLRPDEHAAADRDAAVAVALGVEQAVVVDHHVVADADLVRVAQHDVLAEHDVAPAGPEQPRIEQLPQQQPQRARARTARSS